MPKKRRKLNRDLENMIASAFKKVELINAQINDIQEETIQSEYRSAFDPVAFTYVSLKTLYDKYGFTPETEDLSKQYGEKLAKFEQEYEI